MNLEELQKENETEFGVISARVPKRYVDFVKENNIEAKKLLIWAIDELKKRNESSN